jgi:hypothetical protein
MLSTALIEGVFGAPSPLSHGSFSRLSFSCSLDLAAGILHVSSHTPKSHKPKAVLTCSATNVAASISQPSHLSSSKLSIALFTLSEPARWTVQHGCSSRFCGESQGAQISSQVCSPPGEIELDVAACCMAEADLTRQVSCILFGTTAEQTKARSTFQSLD